LDGPRREVTPIREVRGTAWLDAIARGPDGNRHVLSRSDDVLPIHVVVDD